MNQRAEQTYFNHYKLQKDYDIVKNMNQFERIKSGKVKREFTSNISRQVSIVARTIEKEDDKDPLANCVSKFLRKPI